MVQDQEVPGSEGHRDGLLSFVFEANDVVSFFRLHRDPMEMNSKFKYVHHHRLQGYEKVRKRVGFERKDGLRLLMAELEKSKVSKILKLGRSKSNIRKAISEK